jgi:hypothetical protein
VRECVRACARERAGGRGGGNERESGREGERERGGMRMDSLSNHLCRCVSVLIVIVCVGLHMCDLCICV